MAEKFNFKSSERDSRCAVIQVLLATNFELASAEVSRLCGVPVSTVKDIRDQLMACQDVSMVLERKIKDQDNARKVRSVAWIKKLQELIDLDHTRSLSDLSTEMECGKSTVALAIKEDLKYRSYRRQTGQFLSKKLMERRVLKCCKLLNMLKHPKEPRMLWFFSDEKNFCQDQVHNSQNHRWLAKTPFPKKKGQKKRVARTDIPRVMKTKFPATVMILGVVSSEGDVMPPHFFEAGLKINTDVYLDVLEKVVVPWCKSVAGDRLWVWQQDSAPTHMSKKTQAWLQDREVSGVYSHVPFSHWPPSSPDCNPLDYFVWSYVETMTNRKAHPTKGSLVAAIKAEFAKMDPALFQVQEPPGGCCGC